MGFTIIELMVVVAMLAVLIAIAAPSFGALMSNSRVSNLGNEFVLGVGYARGQAITRNKCVTICAADDISAATPACVVTSGEWNAGWIIFSNPKCDSDATDSTAELLKAYVGDPNGPSLTGTNTPRTILFDSRGRATLAAAVSLRVSPPGESATKMICVDMLGRARIGNAGSISCDGTNQN
ncbi:GspH/FimT family pseudopilin [Variovorax sp. J22R133]|uniref:GspH/FimT family pseudopilin n=1 Tax=Variovorax brevis TaxID=3053503 RepID=UPI0025780DA9|nr:GspH/FimT family pseudopilin [Variovorax sp. J22R133]MDM0115277.1 GspH/FimT family pseudopilin [Variovorax sp. J22R133]